jgi:hypothetical protein
MSPNQRIKCHLTGVELQWDQAYVLNVGAARRAARDLRRRLLELEELLDGLAPRDRVELVSPRGRNVVWHHRVVSEECAVRLRLRWPTIPLFEPLADRVERRRKREAESREDER